MATIICETKRGVHRYRVQFINVDGKRKSIRLGRPSSVMRKRLHGTLNLLSWLDLPVTKLLKR